MDDLFSDGAGASPRLDALLAAATSPPRPDELAGEERAVRAYRIAHASQAADAVTRHRRRWRPAPGWRLLPSMPLKIAAVLAAIGVGSAAVATGGLSRLAPFAGSRPAASVTGDSAHDSRPWTSNHPGAPGGPDAPGGDSPSGRPSEEPDPSATHDLPGLCRAYLKHLETNANKPPRSQAYDELVVAAGGADHVVEYCERLLNIVH